VDQIRTTKRTSEASEENDARTQDHHIRPNLIRGDTARRKPADDAGGWPRAVAPPARRSLHLLSAGIPARTFSFYQFHLLLKGGHPFGRAPTFI